MLPSKIGPYEIKSEIGGNPRGRVFHAYDSRSNREVALKMLRSQSLFTLTGERKFRDGMAAIQALSHPNLMPIIEYGDEDNRPFIVMPLMAANLSQKMAAGPLPVGEMLEWARGLAAALDHAAANGVFHQDLKPNNILFDEHGHPFIGDIGIVQVIESLSAANKPEVNPFYMSPEQVRKRKLTGLSQQYSLAAVLFHALAGEVLFDGATELVASFKHTSERPRSIRRLRPELSEAFAAVMRRALSKEPADRFASSGEFVANLVRAQGGAITPEEVRREQPAQRDPARPPSAALPRVQSPAIQKPDLSSALRMRMFLALGAALTICLCGAVSMVLALFEGP